MVKIGVTGNIGSGKSTVCKVFEQMGWLIYNSDERAKWVMTNDMFVRNQIIKLFGEQTFGVHGELNKKHIADKIFNDPILLKELNGIVHPAVRTDFEEWCSMNGDKAFLIKESALIYEANLQNELDVVILVVVNKEIAVERVMERDGITRKGVMKKLNNQIPYEDKLQFADYVIDNNEPENMVKNTLEVYRKIKSKFT